jgi:hypothetical protein
MPSFTVRSNGPKDDRVVAALAGEKIAYVPDDERSDVQTFQVVALDRRDAGDRVSLALDRQGVSYGTLAIEG